MIRIVVVAPTLAVRAGLRALLVSGGRLDVIAEAASLGDLSPFPSETDVLMLVAGSFGAAELKRTLLSAGAIGVLLLIEEDPSGVQILAQLPVRAWGALPLNSSVEELLAAITAIHEGLIVGEVRRGYRLRERVIRPALVAVAAGDDTGAGPTN